MTQWPLRQIHKEINAYYKKHLAALSSPFSSSSSTLPCPHQSIAQSCESIRTHAGTHTQTHAHMYVQTSVCIMYVAWPDKINAETVHKTFTFYYQPETEKERERVRESEIDKPQQAILNNNRIWWQRRGGVGHCLSTLAHKYA